MYINIDIDIGAMHGFLVEETIPFCVVWFFYVIGFDLFFPSMGELRYNLFVNLAIVLCFSRTLIAWLALQYPCVHNVKKTNEVSYYYGFVIANSGKSSIGCSEYSNFGVSHN